MKKNIVISSKARNLLQIGGFLSRFKKHLRNDRGHSGFTLVELLVYMGIFSILLLVLMQIFTGILSTHLESQATSALSQDGNFILSRLAYDIHRADTVNNPLALGLTDTVLKVTSSGTQYNYTYTNPNLFIIVGGKSYQLNSKTIAVTSFSVTRLGNAIAGGPNKPTVQISLTLKSTVQRPGGVTNTNSFQTTVGTR